MDFFMPKQMNFQVKKKSKKSQKVGFFSIQISAEKKNPENFFFGFFFGFFLFFYKKKSKKTLKITKNFCYF